MRTEISAGGRVFAVTTEESCTRVQLTPLSEGPLSLYKIELSFSGTSSPVTICWPEKMLGIQSTLVHTHRRSRQIQQWYAPTVIHSSFHKGAPILSAVDRGEVSFATVALSDAVWDTALAYAVNDFAQREEVEYTATLCTQPRQIARYETILRVDCRRLPVADAVREAGLWWRAFYPPLHAPNPLAEDDVYSSWYNFHQHPSAAALIRELPLMQRLGFKTLIIDDGWQYDGNGTGDYLDCGNWQPSAEKFPDLAGFVDTAHRHGIRCMLWFPMPFVGRATQAYREFAGRYLDDSDAFRAAILDPRYPSVRRYLVELYSRFVVEYHLDGLKLDFIDSFKTTAATPPCTAEMDEPFVESAAQRLCEEIDEALRAICPDILIEFRQNYIGPAIVRYGNMLRVGDCPFDIHNNRTAIADMRMLGYDAAIHADMLYWHREETAENCMLQMLSILFGVPQISILLADAPAHQLAAVARYLAYWNENRSLLLHGHFTAKHCEAFYSLLRSEDEERAIQVHYIGNVAAFTGKPTDAHNATTEPYLIVDNMASAPASACVYDCTGNLLSAATLPVGTTKLPVPIAGMAHISR